MTRQQAKDLLPVITAFAEGKLIQVRALGDSGVKSDEKWQDVTTDRQSFDNDINECEWEWRIKPEPREFWINVYERMDSWCVHPSKEAANLQKYSETRETIHVREVISEEE